MEIYLFGSMSIEKKDPKDMDIAFFDYDEKWFEYLPALEIMSTQKNIPIDLFLEPRQDELNFAGFYSLKTKEWNWGERYLSSKGWGDWGDSAKKLKLERTIGHLESSYDKALRDFGF
jgi:hypothetical protein